MLLLRPLALSDQTNIDLALGTIVQLFNLQLKDFCYFDLGTSQVDAPCDRRVPHISPVTC